MIKANFIDGGLSPDQRLDKCKIFDRSFQSHMKPDILRQVIADAYLQDPDATSFYYPRDDKLLLALYNKIKTEDIEPLGADGEREWRAAYRVMPDFENWLKYFADELVV